MKTNEAGLNLIKSFEGLRLEAYLCSAGIWTIGYGHTGDVQEGYIITETEAEELFLRDLQNAESIVNDLVKVKLNDNEFSALTSFVFNVGLSQFSESTLLKMLNDQEYQKAADQFLRWNKNGEDRRRILERRLFLS
jgi:GH24 family phage-related lysozyme (muramidase)